MLFWCVMLMYGLLMDLDFFLTFITHLTDPLRYVNPLVSIIIDNIPVQGEIFLIQQGLRFDTLSCKNIFDSNMTLFPFLQRAKKITVDYSSITNENALFLHWLFQFPCPPPRISLSFSITWCKKTYMFSILLRLQWLTR